MNVNDLDTDSIRELYNLISRVQDKLGTSGSFDNDLTPWTFTEGKIAKGPGFSIGVPDGYTAVMDCDNRPFVIVRNSDVVADENEAYIDCDRIFYSKASGTEGLLEIADMIIPEYSWATRRATWADNIYKVDKEWLVQGKNCQCVACRMHQRPNVFEYSVFPIASDCFDGLRLTFYHQDDSMVDLADSNVLKLLATMRVNNGARFVAIERLDRYAARPGGDPDEIAVCLQRIALCVIEAMSKHMECDVAYARMCNPDASRGALESAGAESLVRSYEWAASYASRILDVCETQRSNLDEEKRRLLLGVCRLMIKAMIENVDDDIRKRPEYVIPQVLKDVQARCEALESSLDAPTGKGDRRVEQRPAPQNRSCHSTIERGREPEYVGGGNRIDAMAVMWLLYANKVFFKPGDITWDGSRHAIAGIQINAEAVDEIPILFEHREELMPGVVDLLADLEKDRELVVPVSQIHPQLRGALFNQDLTGITLVNLATIGSSLWIEYAGKESGVDFYRALVDARLASGIPHMDGLVARLIWDLRAYNEIEAPFKVKCIKSRSFDDGGALGEQDAILRSPVAGSHFDESLVDVSEKPDVHAVSGDEKKEGVRRLVQVLSAACQDMQDDSDVVMDVIEGSDAGESVVGADASMPSSDDDGANVAIPDMRDLEKEKENEEAARREAEAREEKLRAERRRRLKELEARWAELDASLNEMKRTIAGLENRRAKREMLDKERLSLRLELAKCGVLALRRKSVLQGQIDELTCRIDELKVGESRLDSLKDEAEQTESKMAEVRKAMEEIEKP